VNVLNGERIITARSVVIGLDKGRIKIRIKPQRNRVGSLRRNLVLNFNKNLTRPPPELIDYVVMH
jgi:predicted metal-dependent hydrolase